MGKKIHNENFPKKRFSFEIIVQNIFRLFFCYVIIPLLSNKDLL